MTPHSIVGRNNPTYAGYKLRYKSNPIYSPAHFKSSHLPMCKEHYVVLVSNSREGNTNSVFTTILPKPLELYKLTGTHSRWLVGISEITTTFSWDQIRKPQKIKITKADGDVKTFVLPVGNYRNHLSLLNSLHNLFSSRRKRQLASTVPVDISKQTKKDFFEANKTDVLKKSKSSKKTDSNQEERDNKENNEKGNIDKSNVVKDNGKSDPKNIKPDNKKPDNKEEKDTQQSSKKSKSKHEKVVVDIQEKEKKAKEQKSEPKKDPSEKKEKIGMGKIENSEAESPKESGTKESEKSKKSYANAKETKNEDNKKKELNNPQIINKDKNNNKTGKTEEVGDAKNLQHEQKSKEENITPKKLEYGDTVPSTTQLSTGYFTEGSLSGQGVVAMTTPHPIALSQKDPVKLPVINAIPPREEKSDPGEIRISAEDVMYKYGLKFVYDKEQFHFRLEIDKNKIHSVELDRELTYIMGFDKSILTESTISKYMPDFQNNFNNIYCYSSVVEPTILGNTRSDILRVISLADTPFGAVLSKQFPAIQYRPVRTNTITSIDIRLLDEQGIPLKHHFGTTVVVLHFIREN